MFCVVISLRCKQGGKYLAQSRFIQEKDMQREREREKNEREKRKKERERERERENEKSGR